MSNIELTHKPPVNGWLTLSLTIDGQTTEMDASDVPNDPIFDLTNALDSVSDGEPSTVWWHLEPDGYYMHFTPIASDIELRLTFAENSDETRQSIVVSTRGDRSKILLPFWLFLRKFQSHDYTEPHWPKTDASRMQVIKAKIIGGNEA